jgi:DNA-binding IclR family transcriptional regulator
VGLCSVGVPLRDYRGSVVAALTIAGPATRLTAGTLQQHLGPLIATAHRIEAHLGATNRS